MDIGYAEPFGIHEQVVWLKFVRVSNKKRCINKTTKEEHKFKTDAKDICNI